MTSSSAVARAATRSPRTRAARRSAAVRSSSSVMPITPFSGVRISWLMLARNSDLARDASSACAGQVALGHVGAHRHDRGDLPASESSGNFTS